MYKYDLGKILITGGTGFIGSSLTRYLINLGHDVTVFDNNLRGNISRLSDIRSKLKFIEGDITKINDVVDATKDIDTIFHLAFINGTDNFYNHPDKVLEVGVKGAINTLDAAKKNRIKNYIVTSSSEVYQEPTNIPTTEDERIIIPDIMNPRFSYSGAKIITELLSLHYLKETNIRSIICRPHNFYGPDMGEGHVIPQLTRKMISEYEKIQKNMFEFEIQGSGDETRSFCHIDDAVMGIYKCSIYGENKEIYHIGTLEEISIKYLTELISSELGYNVKIKASKARSGGTMRRCPDISKITKLGYKPQIDIKKGIKNTINWYKLNSLENIINSESLIK